MELDKTASISLYVQTAISLRTVNQSSMISVFHEYLIVLIVLSK